jgi:hypothetical protein
VKWGDVYASIPKDEDPEAVDLDMAIDLIAAKVAKQLGDKTGGIVVDPAKMPAGKARQRSAPRERMEVDGNHVDGPRMVRAGSGGGGKPGGGKPGGGGGGAGRGGRGRGGQRGSGGGGQRKGGGNA